MKPKLIMLFPLLQLFTINLTSIKSRAYIYVTDLQFWQLYDIIFRTENDLYDVGLAYCCLCYDVNFSPQNGLQDCLHVRH